jgi:hypothetical protein
VTISSAKFVASQVHMGSSCCLQHDGGANLNMHNHSAALTIMISALIGKLGAAPLSQGDSRELHPDSVEPQ